MRTDENGNKCPETLGEYRDLCAALGGEDNAAVAFLDEKIEGDSERRNAVVMQPDSQMRALLMPMIIHPADNK